MKMTEYIKFKRLAKVILNDLQLQAKTILMVAATLIVIFILLPFDIIANTTTYFLILFIGGFIVTSFAFNDLHDNRRAYLVLTIPCSNLERFISKWLLTSFVFALGSLLLYYLFSILSSAIYLLIYNIPMSYLNLFQTDLWIGIGKYIILQAVVLLGAISFKKYALIKTVFTLGCIFVVVAFFTLIFAWLFCPGCFAGALVSVVNATLKGSYFIFWIILAPFCWYMTYLKLTESELL